MKYRLWFLLTVFIVIGSLAYGQQVGKTDVQRGGELEVINTNASDASDKKVATELVQTLLVDDFETAGEWSANTPRDFGIAMAMRREGAPRDLASEKNRYVLGVKVAVRIGRGHVPFRLGAGDGSEAECGEKGEGT